MAFEADCGKSTVLKALRVVRASGSAVFGDCWTMCGARRTHYKTQHEVPAALVVRLACTADFLAREKYAKIWIAFPRAVKSEIRNSKFEIPRKTSIIPPEAL